MALRAFDPDPDLFDPNDPESWYGTWHHDDGSSFYGQGSADIGEPLLQQKPPERVGQPDQRLASNADDEARQWAAEGGQQTVGQAPPQRLDAPTTGKAPAPQRAVEAPSVGVDAETWQDDVPPEVAGRLIEEANAAGLNPAVLAKVIKKESGWDPSALNPKSKAHAGLIQFSRDGWDGVAKAAGRPDVTWDQMRSMSAAEQVPFVVAYYKDKGLTPESGIGEYGLRTFMPAYANEADDFALAERDSNERRGNLRSGKIYEQNAQMDANQDGRITRAEGAQFYGGSTLAGGAPPGPPAPGGGAVPGAGGPGALPPFAPNVPGQMGGLPLAQATMAGVPRTPGQVQQSQQNVAQRYAAAMGTKLAADDLRAQGAQQAMALVEKNHAEQNASREAEMARRQKAQQDAYAKIEAEVNAPIAKLDPKRYITNMSTGDKVIGAIALIVSAIGQAANSMLGIQSPNTALQVLQGAIEKDIDAQKEDLASGREQRAGRLSHWRNVLGNETDALDALKGEQKMVAGRMLEMRANQVLTDANQKAQVMEYAGQMFAEGQAAVQAIADRETERMHLQFQAPAAVKADPQKLVATIQAAKTAAQELKATGQYNDAQIDEILVSNGLPALRGDTVEQAQHKADQTRASEQHKADQARADAKLTDSEKMAEAAFVTLDAYAKTNPLERNAAGQWVVKGGSDAPELGWRLDQRDRRSALAAAAIESFGRLESQGVIGKEEEQTFKAMISGALTPSRLAEDLNAIELIINAKRNAVRVGQGSGIPQSWKGGGQ
jgi:hypothetical protein